MLQALSIRSAFPMLVLAVACAAGRAQSWSAATQFSPSQNPNGAWHYGWSTSLGGALIPFTMTTVSDGGIQWWFRGGPSLETFPGMAFNPTSAPLFLGGNPGSAVAPGVLILHPGPAETNAVLRWTSPLVGWFRVTAVFRGNSSACGAIGSTCDVHVLTNGIERFAGDILGYGSVESTELTVFLGVGDTVEFIVGSGPGDEISCDHIATDATLTYLGTACTTAWQAGPGPASGMDGEIYALTTLANGDLIAGGAFNTAGGVSASRIARWDGTAWSPLGVGTNGYVSALATSPSGDLVVGGFFTTAGGVNRSNIARWNGTAWASMGGFNGEVSSLAQLSSGEMIAGGWFTTGGGPTLNRIARWNGAGWSPFLAGMSGEVLALLPQSNTAFVAGGNFGSAGAVAANRIARWTGGSWVQMGQGMGNTVRALTTWNGMVVAGGTFTTAGGVLANRIATWNGFSWSALGLGLDGPVYALTTLPNGDLVAAGSFIVAGGSWVTNRIARWNGVSWSYFGAGVDNTVRAMTRTPDGKVVVAGSFGQAGGVSTLRVARLTPTCAASAAAIGTPCAGTAGPLSLAVTALPWGGSSYRATASGFATGALGLRILGLSAASTPLSSLHPAGVGGCLLLASTDDVALLVPTSGVAQFFWTLPYTSAFAGLAVRNQVVQVELDSQPQVTSLSASNAFALTVGWF